MALRTLLGVAMVARLAAGFPDGAPVDACVKPRPNQPYHGQARPQPPHTNPFVIVASDSSYGPGSKITVRIFGQGREPFRGFFLQARDASSDQWTGSWEEQKPYTNGHPECSAITHGDNKDKVEVTLTWVAPQNTRGGHVYFTGSVVQDYPTFWVDMQSVVSPS